MHDLINLNDYQGDAGASLRVLVEFSRNTDVSSISGKVPRELREWLRLNGAYLYDQHMQITGTPGHYGPTRWLVQLPKQSVELEVRTGSDLSTFTEALSGITTLPVPQMMLGLN